VEIRDWVDVAGAAVARAPLTSTGVEVRTMGFRLRSIPVEQIRGYTVGPWSVAGGYGIRELKSRRRRAVAREEYFIRQQQKLYDTLEIPDDGSRLGKNLA